MASALENLADRIEQSLRKACLHPKLQLTLNPNRQEESYRRIRVAERTEQDATALHALTSELAAHERMQHEVVLDKRSFINFYCSKDFPLFGLLAEKVNATDKGEEKTTAIGCAFCFLSFSSWRGQYLHLEDLYVQPEFRGSKIGFGLIDTVLRVVHETELPYIQWVVSSSNIAAIDFYQKIGAKLVENFYVAGMDKRSLEEYCKYAEDNQI